MKNPFARSPQLKSRRFVSEIQTAGFSCIFCNWKTSVSWDMTEPMPHEVQEQLSRASAYLNEHSCPGLKVALLRKEMGGKLIF